MLPNDWGSAPASARGLVFWNTVQDRDRAPAHSGTAVEAKKRRDPQPQKGVGVHGTLLSNFIKPTSEG